MRGLVLALCTGWGVAAGAQGEVGWTAGLPVRDLGPRVMSGRVVDLAVRPGDGSEFYVAYATGGVFHTRNHGTSFEPVFDHAATTAVGCVAADWERGRLYVGTGEVNASRSSYAGSGVYRSTDGGATWTSLGLGEAHHIGRILLHPTEPNVLWVAAAGPLYSDNTTGGVYRSDDGGATWARTLGGAAAIDLLAHPRDPDHLFAALWDRTRRAWDFTESGPASGVFESRDGGRTWTDLTERGGLPERGMLGRMGLAYHPDNELLYVLLDDQTPLPSTAQPGLKPTDFAEMSARQFARLDTADLRTYFSEHGIDLPLDSVRDLIATGVHPPAVLRDYVTDGNRALFESGVVGASVYTYDGTWQRTHTEPLEGVCYTYGYYFGLIEVGPDGTVYIAGVPLLKSSDGGATWSGINAPNVHVDHHALWVNPDRPEHLINGNDGGINISWDGGAHWLKCNHTSVAQCYAIEVDDADPYTVYVGLQDNGVWAGPSDYTPSSGWHASGRYPWEELGGGDGMQIEVDPRNPDRVYFGSQFGWYQRLDRASGERLDIHPKHALGETPLRWNWQTPILVSRHAPDTVYIGAQRVFRSTDAGEHWEAISGDLTRGGRPGDVPYGTLTSLHESPRVPGRLAVGSDDGRLHVSLDGGATWEERALPVDSLWVSEVLWSAHADDRLYAALNGYRWDDFAPRLYRSEDSGATWDALHGGLPSEPVNAVCESADREDHVFVGTDGGAYASWDGGATWARVHPEVPRAPVHDLAYQARTKELVIGTHGRSVWAVELGILAEQAVSGAAALLLPADTTLYREEWAPVGWRWGDQTPPTATAWGFLPEPGEAELDVRDGAGRSVATVPLGTRPRGWQRVELPLEGRDWEAGRYTWQLRPLLGPPSEATPWVISTE